MVKDSLFRISFKCVILNKDGNVLVVKERDRTSWDLPGGGIEHGESIEESVARELFEEVSFRGKFKYTVIDMTDPEKLATRDIWQVQVILHLQIDNLDFAVGSQADEVVFIDPEVLRDSSDEAENRILDHAQLALGRLNSS